MFGLTGSEEACPRQKAAGLSGLRFHDLRHTHITHAIESGEPIEVVMAQVGHLSADMTRYYTHLSSGAKHSCVQALQDKGAAIMDQLHKGDLPSVSTNAALEIVP